MTKKAVLKAYTEEIERLRRDLVASREKNGVFMDKENYDFLTTQVESQGQDLADKIAQVRSLEEVITKKDVWN
jgi:kinesin family protein 11